MTAEREKLKIRLENNMIAASSITRTDLALERELHQTKWFDYRFISPMEATHQFRVAYSEIYRRMYARNISTEDAMTRSGVRAGPAFQCRTELTSFWRARQTADSYGLPYIIFIDVAMETLTRGGGSGFPIQINSIQKKTSNVF